MQGVIKFAGGPKLAAACAGVEAAGGLTRPQGEPQRIQADRKFWRVIEPAPCSKLAVACPDKEITDRLVRALWKSKHSLPLG